MRNVQKTIERMKILGFLMNFFAGIQIHVTTFGLKVNGVYVQRSKCDHNCTLKHGGYECPDARSLNLGDSTSFAPKEQMLEWIVIAAEGMCKVRDLFYKGEGFVNFCKKFKIPDVLRNAIIAHMLEAKLEINLFGGEPYLVPYILWLIAKLKELGFVVNMTTTGGKIVMSQKFREDFLANPSDVLALSIDETPEDELVERINWDFARHQTEVLRILKNDKERDFGQRRKAAEAMALLAYGREHPGALPTTIINAVVYAPTTTNRGNLSWIHMLIEKVGNAFPVLVNPYPAQSLGGERRIWTPGEIKTFYGFVTNMRQRHLDEDGRITKRLHYYHLLEAVHKVYGHDPQACGDLFAGEGAWFCFKNAPVSYLQIGQAPSRLVQVAKPGQDYVPGGRLNCGWNTETIGRVGVIRDVEEIVNYVMYDMVRIAKKASNPCGGCIMPRLMLHFIATWIGILESLIPEVLRLAEEDISWAHLETAEAA